LEVPVTDEHPIELSRVAADDALLDALGRGGRAPASAADDPAAVLLAAWRADLAADVPDAPDEPGWPPDALAGGLDVPVAPPRPRGRRLARIALAAAATVVVAAGLAISAHQAGPGSPLWPIARIIYPQQAEVLAAEHAIADARTAAADGRADDARRLLDVAWTHVGRIDDAAVAARLRAEIEETRRGLNATAVPATPGMPVPPLPSAGPSTMPSVPAPEPPAVGGTPVPAPPPPAPNPPLLPDLPLPDPPRLPDPLPPIPPLPPPLPIPPLPLPSLPSLPPVLPG
jgi:hypothetical protein